LPKRRKFAQSGRPGCRTQIDIIDSNFATVSSESWAEKNVRCRFWNSVLFQWNARVVSC
jgi:hypothetical protein